MEKTVKTRKDHNCDYCSEVIKKGEKANFMSLKSGRFDSDDIQIGIEYYSGWMHSDVDICNKNIDSAV